MTALPAHPHRAAGFKDFFGLTSSAMPCMPAALLYKYAERLGHHFIIASEAAHCPTRDRSVTPRSPRTDPRCARMPRRFPAAQACMDVQDGVHVLLWALAAAFAHFC